MEPRAEFVCRSSSLRNYHSCQKLHSTRIDHENQSLQMSSYRQGQNADKSRSHLCALKPLNACPVRHHNGGPRRRPLYRRNIGRDRASARKSRKENLEDGKYRCQFCGKLSSSPADLRRHEFTHNSLIKKYHGSYWRLASQCNATCRRKEELRKHLETCDHYRLVSTRHPSSPGLRSVCSPSSQSAIPWDLPGHLEHQGDLSPDSHIS
jgi:hypothetical protein